ncbi:MAG: hypothetical protein GY757_51205 [bacterium]|nr:hypothetical protein [bacterium]
MMSPRRNGINKTKFSEALGRRLETVRQKGHCTVSQICGIMGIRSNTYKSNAKGNNVPALSGLLRSN